MDLENIDQNANESASINIMGYVLLVWHWAWLILLVGIIAGGVAYFVSSRQTPIYETSTSLLINDPPAAISGGTVASSAIASGVNSAVTYSQMLANNKFLDQVIAALGWVCDPSTSPTPTAQPDSGTTAQSGAAVTPQPTATIPSYCPFSRSMQKLRGSLSVSVLPNTQIINVSVTDTNPAIAVKIAGTIGEEFKKYIQGIQTERFANSEDSVITQIEGLKADRDKLDPKSVEWTQLNNQVTLAQNSLAAVQLSKAQSSTNVIVIENPEMPTSPISPRTLLNVILAAIVGILLGTGGVFLVEYLDDSIKNPDEVRLRYHLPVLGLIATHTTTDNKPITLDQPRNPISEAFRALRTNIQYTSVDHPVYTLLVTSATPQDGKTTISTNLAIALAQGGKKVVIIDADMRRPKLHQRLNLQNRTGLSNLFVNPLSYIASATQSTPVENLSVITSGGIPPNPAELLSSKKMAQILEKLHETFDVVLIDTPPVLSVTDAVALSTMVDGVLVVAKPGSTKSAAFKQALEALQRVNANILGAVMNDIEPRNSRYGYYYRQYYSKYVYYYDEATGEKIKKKKVNKEHADIKR